MALIENLEREGWEEFLQNCFRQTLDLLQNDRYGFAGSSVDDLKGWLTAGGIARVQYHLSDQAKSRGFSVDHQEGIKTCIENLAREHRLALLNLMARGTIPGSTREVLASCKFSEMELNNLLDRLERGEHPFEVLMSAQGYGIIDQWLLSSQN
jgi:hypothetical protein